MVLLSVISILPTPPLLLLLPLYLPLLLLLLPLYLLLLLYLLLPLFFLFCLSPMGPPPLTPWRSGN